jgi:predicted acylesterase/phospholipase RssA
MSLSHSQDKKNFKRTLIISGGGTRASWGSGFAKGLVKSGKEYEIVGGTSAGALIMSSIILNQFEELETLFNSINNKDIYNVNPLRPNGEIRVLNSIFRTLFGYPSIGESKNLRKLIEKIFTKEDYNAIQEQQKILFCVTTNLNTSKKFIKSTQSSKYKDMLDWIWASASVPVLMKPVEKEGQSWVDGGLIDNIPIKGAVVKGAKIIDVIALFPETPVQWKSSNKLIEIAGRAFDIFLLNTSFRDDIVIGELLSELAEGTEINIYYMPEKDANFLSNIFSFEHEILSEGFRRGYDSFKNTTMLKKTYIMKGDAMIYKK